MTTITVTEFRAKTYEIIGRVEAGEALEITRHGKIIAEIVPKNLSVKHDERKRDADLSQS